MNQIIITIIVILSVIFVLYILWVKYIVIGYINKRRSDNLKIGDKCRVFTTETDFKFIKIVKINKNMALCKYDNGDEEEIKLIDLIY